MTKFETMIKFILIILVTSFKQSVSESTKSRQQASVPIRNNPNFINLKSINSNNNREATDIVVLDANNNDFDLNNMQIFINQSNNLYILAKYGQTISLPCLIHRQRTPELANIHAIWYKLIDKQRPLVLSIGTHQLKQDMRFRVKVADLNSISNNMSSNSNSDFKQEDYSIQGGIDSEHSKYLVQNWQFEIRKLTYDDAGTYQCLLPLVKPLFKNITLQVIPDLVIEPKEANFKVDEKIVIKCKATIKSHHRKHHNNHVNQRQHRQVIHWYKEDEIIKMSDLKRNKLDPAHQNNEGHGQRKFQIETRQEHDGNHLNSVLTINNAKPDDSGRYRCIYDNIQEQTTVKVFNDLYEYKNYFSSSSASTSSSKSHTSRAIHFLALVLVLFLI